MAFAENLKRIRKEKGISQEQLAELLDVSRQAVSKWEQGLAYSEVEKLVMLSKKLNVSLDALMADSYAAEGAEMPELNAAEEESDNRRRKGKKTLRIALTCAALLTALLLAGVIFMLLSGKTAEGTVTGTRIESGEVVARYADSLVIEADGVVIQGLGKNHPDAQVYYAFYVDDSTEIEGADGAELKSLWTVEPGMSVEIAFKPDENGKPLEQAGSTYIPMERTDVLALSVKIVDSAEQ